jgi:lysyl-tRNA synthetase class I
VARTSWVRRAYTELTGQASHLLAFSDDMDALRKVPDNVPKQEMLAGYIGQPLSRVPDPFGTHESFAAHNNAVFVPFLTVSALNTSSLPQQPITPRVVSTRRFAVCLKSMMKFLK